MGETRTRALQSFCVVRHGCCAFAVVLLFSPRSVFAVENSPAAADTALAVSFDTDSPVSAPGPLIAGGLTLAPGEGGSIGYRLDAGTALSSSERSELRLLLALSFDHNSKAGFETYGLAPFLTVEYARSILQRPNGRIAAIAEAGAGPIFAWFKTPDLPYMPARWDSEIRPGGRLAGAFEYRSVRGWFGLLQPAGVVFAWVNDELEGSFEFGLRGGYQWQ